MEQKAVQKFESDCKKCFIMVENDMSLGAFHDFLLYIKGLMVQKMVDVQKQEEEITKAQKQQSCCDDAEDCQKEEITNAECIK